MALKKIVITCYACSPTRGSEPGMGWSFVTGLSQFFEVHAIVEEVKWRRDIEAYLETHPELAERLKVYYIPKKRGKMLRKLWPPSYYWFYKQWQKKAHVLACELHKKEQFQLSHHLNMVGYREPGYLWRMDLPFVWGPVGGLQNTSWKLFDFLDFYGKLYYGGRNVYNSLQAQFLQRPKKAAQRSRNHVIAATPDIKHEIQRLWNTEASIITEVGTLDLDKITPSKRLSGEALRIVWSGQHTPGKALNILLKSLKLLPKEMQWELHVLGVGSETKKWQRLAKELRIDHHITWHGWLPKAEAIHIMTSGHVFCITSIKDLTSTVLLEAISLGLPVVTLDHCGFSHVVDANCGVKIPITTSDTIIKDFARALQTLYQQESKRQQLALGALQRAQDFNWNDKVLKLKSLYEKLLDESITHT